MAEPKPEEVSSTNADATPTAAPVASDEPTTTETGTTPQVADVTTDDQPEPAKPTAPEADEKTAVKLEEQSPAPTTTELPAQPEKHKRFSRKPVPSYINIDKSKPEDFEGEVLTTNELPSQQTLDKIEDYIVLDRHGKSHTFKSLYNGTNVARRVLMIFIRHFFCGNCQDYIRSLSDSISPDALLGLPVSTFIVVIGCGDPAFIENYAKDTGCQFPIYTDPKRSIFDALGMKQTLAMGQKPAYLKRPMSTSIFSSIGQGLKALPSGLALKGGNQRQVGGEFLFEPSDLVTPVTTPREEKQKTIGSPEEIEAAAQNGGDAQEEDTGTVETKQITWCHRMKTTRDHCEIPELMEILGLDGQGSPIKDQERWKHALLNRKGTGSSMARQMSELSTERKMAT